MRKMSKFAGLFDKYASFEEKKVKDNIVEQFNWNGYRNIAGTYKGAGYSTNLADNFTASNLRNDSNPKGSLLVAAKNYTDSKVKNLYYHFINLYGSSGSVYVTYISEYASKYTIATLKNALSGKSLVCGGYLNGVAEYISSEGGNLVVGVVDVTDGSTTGETIDNTFSITDEVTPI